jgi:hypothetical protein
LERKARELVRLALFNEYQRKPLKREDISKKGSKLSILPTSNETDPFFLSFCPPVLGEHSRAFREVLEAAQKILRETFGMELVILRAKGTGLGDPSGAGGLEGDDDDDGEGGAAGEGEGAGEPTKRRTKKPPPSTNQYILRSTLDAKIVSAAATVVSSDEEDEDEGDHAPKGRDAAELREWQRDEGAVLEWKKADQRALMGILHVILALILVNGRVLGDGKHIYIFFFSFLL